VIAVQVGRDASVEFHPRNHRPIYLIVEGLPHYIVLFNNPVDRQPIATLGRQTYHSRRNFLLQKFDEATERPYGYLIFKVSFQFVAVGTFYPIVFSLASLTERFVDGTSTYLVIS
jgi:hypothetical protein